MLPNPVLGADMLALAGGGVVLHGVWGGQVTELGVSPSSATKLCGP